MSYQEKRSIVNLASTMILPAIFAAVMLPRYPEGEVYSAGVFQFWGEFFLLLIVASIIARIAISIVFSIINTIATREVEPSITDERDQLIEMKANTRSLYLFSLGFIIGIGSLAFGQTPNVMFIIFFCAGIAAEIMSDVSQFFFYRRGF